ncbi:hypothetical protein FOZ76_25140 [Verticiella sediminum]|uniref:DUF169 domain-containing protein n=1 Tax=Verticiella sediminum TaxID=1247510 RepID=A0A556A7R6_9BURK|nr:DUF169 domain-containing protein [Verticiella sediminum]TSH88920.1 hypothetical protein FOZ76_25140 [Verticiella sediminum]
MNTALSLSEHGAIVDRIQRHLRLRTLPLALQLFETVDAMARVPGIRWPAAGVRFSMCQLVGQARWLGWTLGATHENVAADSNCGGVMGLNAPATKYLDGSMFHGVWFATVEASRQHQAQMPRVPHGRYVGVVLAPLASNRLSAPDAVLVYATPGQMILLINALQHRNYVRYQFSTTGETACADSWGAGLLTREPSMSLPCFAERRFGGVQDDELLIALQVSHLEEIADGLDWLAGHGIRYPIAPYGMQCDPAIAFQASYAGKL